MPPLLQSRPIEMPLPNFASNCVQNRWFCGSVLGLEASKANYINRSYGAGDGNRIASQISKPHRIKALAAAPRVNCCQMLPNRSRRRAKDRVELPQNETWLADHCKSRRALIRTRSLRS